MTRINKSRDGIIGPKPKPVVEPAPTPEPKPKAKKFQPTMKAKKTKRQK